jgi:energy-coupling factor transporter ATP-binding protein EcfA2
VTALLDAIGRLRGELARASLGLEVAGAAEARRARDELIGQFDDYLVPRLRRIDAPMLVVVGGSTGAGKSTLVNSLVGVDVSPAGVLRPTTRSPVLVCHPDDEAWFAGDRVLPGLARTTGGSAAAGGGLHVVPTPTVPPGMGVLDAPDVDSVVAANRDLAAQLLAAADLWLFVTTAARYADAVPWGFLRTARERSTAMAVVLNRVPEEAGDEVSAHLASMLAGEGLGGVRLFVVGEAALADGRIPEPMVFPVRRWLFELAADAGRRAAVVRTTLEGALASIAVRAGQVAAAVDQQAAVAGSLGAAVERAYGDAREEVGEGVAGGSLLRGEVLARWQEFVGTGELLRTLEARVGQLRDRVRRAVTGRRPPAAEVEVAVTGAYRTLLVGAADRAAARVVDQWTATAGGPSLVGGEARSLARATPGLGDTAAAEVAAWQGHVLDLVAAQGAARRTAAKVASYGVNAAGVALMVAVFAQTGGLTGGEVVVAGGTATLSQKVLEAVFGDQAVRLLAAEALEDLLVRTDRLLAGESARFRHRLAEAAPAPGAGQALRDAVAAVEAARR